MGSSLGDVRSHSALCPTWMLAGLVPFLELEATDILMAAHGRLDASCACGRRSGDGWVQNRRLSDSAQTSWDQVRTITDLDFVCTPVTHQGEPLGVLAALLSGPVVWNQHNTLLLRAATSAFGLWLVGQRTARCAGDALSGDLTARQQAVLLLRAADKTYGRIAHQLGCSESTIARETRHLISQFGTSDPDLMVRIAQDRGLVPTDPVRG